MNQQATKKTCENETIHYLKSNNSFLNTLLSFMEYDGDKEVSFKGETMTFKSQISKI